MTPIIAAKNSKYCFRLKKKSIEIEWIVQYIVDGGAEIRRVLFPVGRSLHLSFTPMGPE